MPYMQKPAFEQYRYEVISAGKPMLERNIVPIQERLIKELDGIKALLIEKTKRLPHDDGMLEISAKWFGLDAGQDDVVRQFRKGWPEPSLSAENVNFWVGKSDEAVLVMFAATYADGRFLTGRMLVTF